MEHPTTRTTVTVLPDAIRAWRAERQLSQAALADRAGISEGFVAQIETGRRQPSPTNLAAIAQALGVKVNAIALVTSPEPPRPPAVFTELHHADHRSIEDLVDAAARALGSGDVDVIVNCADRAQSEDLYWRLRSRKVPTGRLVRTAPQLVGA